MIHFVVCYYAGFSGEVAVPSWVCFFTAFFYLFYNVRNSINVQYLDTLDGKQARATNSSSPMGLLLDHGSDAVTTFLFLPSMAAIFRLCIYM